MAGSNDQAQPRRNARSALREVRRRRRAPSAGATGWASLDLCSQCFPEQLNVPFRTKEPFWQRGVLIVCEVEEEHIFAFFPLHIVSPRLVSLDQLGLYV